MKVLQAAKDKASPRSSIKNRVEEKENSGKKANGLLLLKDKTLGSTKTGQQIRAKIHRTTLPMKQITNESSRQNRHMKMAESIIIQKEESETQNRSNPKSVKFSSIDDDVSSSKSHTKKSILKNKLALKKSSIHFDKRSMNSSGCSHYSMDQSVQNLTSNKVIKEKYEKLLLLLKEKSLKYTDQVYPPIKSSLYLQNSLMREFCEMFEAEGKKIQWMRIPDVFPHKNLIVWSSKSFEKCTVSKGYISKVGSDCDYLPSAFNSIRSKNSIMEKLFQSQIVNYEGIYYVKMHQTQMNNWKYCIIDDYIPVIINTNLRETERYLPQNVIPAFLKVASKGQKLEIWPFLLQKVYAKYYSTYDALSNGNYLDFIEEITGVMLENVKVHQNMAEIQQLISNSDSILIGEDKNKVLYPLQIPETSDETGFPYKRVACLRREDSYKEKILGLFQLAQTFEKIHFGFLHKYLYAGTCVIKQQSIDHVKNAKSKSSQAILRHFSIQESTSCQISLLQKEQRFYRAYSTYEYSWIRMILVMKEHRGYRWIGAEYSNKKSMKITSNLNAGDYIIIILPEWRSAAYDMNLVYLGNLKAELTRKSYEEYQNIVPQSCMDIAQRFGKMTQINKNICSYNYIERKIGLVIENINNQKEHGQVKIVRSIDGLQGFRIQPLNEDFKSKPSIQIRIKQNGYYTVVLGTIGGIDQQFLDQFDFGS